MKTIRVSDDVYRELLNQKAELIRVQGGHFSFSDAIEDLLMVQEMFVFDSNKR